MNDEEYILIKKDEEKRIFYVMPQAFKAGSIEATNAHNVYEKLLKDALEKDYKIVSSLNFYDLLLLKKGNKRLFQLMTIGYDDEKVFSNFVFVADDKLFNKNSILIDLIYHYMAGKDLENVQSVLNSFKILTIPFEMLDDKEKQNITIVPIELIPERSLDYFNKDEAIRLVKVKFDKVL